MCSHNTQLNRSGPSLGFLLSAEKPANLPCSLQFSRQSLSLQEPILHLWLTEGTIRYLLPHHPFSNDSSETMQLASQKTSAPICISCASLRKKAYCCCLYEQLQGSAHYVPPLRGLNIDVNACALSKKLTPFITETPSGDEIVQDF